MSDESLHDGSQTFLPPETYESLRLQVIDHLNAAHAAAVKLAHMAAAQVGERPAPPLDPYNMTPEETTAWREFTAREHRRTWLRISYSRIRGVAREYGRYAELS